MKYFVIFSIDYLSAHILYYRTDHLLRHVNYIPSPICPFCYLYQSADLITQAQPSNLSTADIHRKEH